MTERDKLEEQIRDLKDVCDNAKKLLFWKDSKERHKWSYDIWNKAVHEKHTFHIHDIQITSVGKKDDLYKKNYLLCTAIFEDNSSEYIIVDLED